MKISANSTANILQNNSSDSMKKVENKGISMEDFFHILSAELKNQDPLSGGGSNTDYVAQMAQFAVLEQINTIGDTLNYMSNFMTDVYNKDYAFQLIGKNVTVQDNDDEVNGVVQKVRFSNEGVKLVVNDKEFDINNLLEVSDKE